MKTRLLKQRSLALLLATAAAVSARADNPLTINFLNANNITNYVAPTNLTFSVDGSGNLKGGSGLIETFSGTSTNVADFTNVLTVTAWMPDGSGTYSKAVSSGNLGGADEFLTKGLNASSNGWNTSSGLTQLGFGVLTGTRVAPAQNPTDTSWALETEFMLLSFQSPPTHDMKISTTGANTSWYFKPGNVYASNAVSGNSFGPLAIAAGATYNLLVAQLGGSGRGLKTVTVEFGVGFLDTTPPAVVSVAGFDAIQDTVVVTFSETVNSTDALNLSNYRLTNHLGNSVAITSASLAGGNVVTLVTGTIVAGTTNTLTVMGVRDVAAIPNMMVTTNIEFVVVAGNPKVTVDWRQATANVTVAGSNLIYSLNSSGNLTGGSGLETFTGAALATNVANLLTVRAFDAISFAYDGVVLSNSLPNGANDYVTQALTNSTWDPTSPMLLQQVGYGLALNNGLTPAADQTFLYQGPHFLQLDFNAPTNGGLSMRVTFGAQGNLAVYKPGDTDPMDGRNASGFSKVFAPGESGSLLVWNFNVNDPSNAGGARRLRWCTMEFLIPPPPDTTLTITEAGGTITVAWDPVIGTLQSAPTVTGSWSNLATNSPYVQPGTNSAQFFRVVGP